MNSNYDIYAHPENVKKLDALTDLIPKFLQINNADDQIHFNYIFGDMDSSEVDLLTNWGKELYRTGFFKGILIGGGIYISAKVVSLIARKIKEKKENEDEQV